MDILELIEDISEPSPDKIVLVMIDGIGGLPHPLSGKTELETALTPNLDFLTSKGNCGLIDPVSPGITTGSMPGHMAIFGFDPLTYNIGRGAMEAIGINYDLQAEDIVARGNFATIDENNIVIDRRAGRLPTEKTTELCKLLDGMQIEDIKLIVKPVKDYRFIVIFRGQGLASAVSSSDPQTTGVKQKEISHLNIPSEKTARIANRFISKSRELLKGQFTANAILLRGFSKRPQFQSLYEIYKLNAAGISPQPMQRGLARLVGMEVLDTGNSINDELDTLVKYYSKYDFFYFHVKQVDTAGEDGDFEGKVKAIEQVDNCIKEIMALKPEVVVVTGDHSTPAIMGLHSWHPVPTIIYSKWCRPDRITKFSEYNCVQGSLGRFPATQLMPLTMANARKLGKFGA